MLNDKVILAATFMCDLSWLDCVRLDGTVDKDMWMSWHRPLANAGASIIRNTLGCFGGTAPKSVLLTPWIYVPSQDKFDLSLHNPNFFKALRTIAEYSNDIGNTYMCCVGNECEQRKPDRKAQSPWFNNVNGVSGMYDERALPYWSALTKAVLDTLDGLDIMIEPVNEQNDSKGRDVSRLILEILHARNFPVNHISLGGMMIKNTWVPDGKWPDDYTGPEFSNQDMIAKDVDIVWQKAHVRNETWWPVHGTGRYLQYPKVRPFGEVAHQAVDWWVLHNGNSQRIFFSCDGTEDFSTGPNFGRPPAEWWSRFIAYVLDLGKRNILIGNNQKFCFEIFQSGTVDEFAKVVDAAAKTIMALGFTLENYGKYPEPVPVPDPEPQPEPEPQPQPEPTPEPKISAWKYLIPVLSSSFPFVKINFRRWWKAIDKEAPVIKVKKKKVWWLSLIVAAVIVGAFLLWPSHVIVALCASILAAVLVRVGVTVIP